MKRIIKVIGLPTAGFAIVLIGLVYDTFLPGSPIRIPRQKSNLGGSFTSL